MKARNASYQFDVHLENAECQWLEDWMLEAVLSCEQMLLCGSTTQHFVTISLLSCFLLILSFVVWSSSNIFPLGDAFVAAAPLLAGKRCQRHLSWALRPAAHLDSCNHPCFGCAEAQEGPRAGKTVGALRPPCQGGRRRASDRALRAGCEDMHGCRCDA